MKPEQKNYQFIEATTSLCPHCLKRVDAKIILKDNKIYILKYCFEHGEQLSLLEEEADYYLKRMAFTKPGSVSKIQTERKNNCPFDCGLCPEHEQHTCIGLIEVTQNCNLSCPTCYASSGPASHLTLEKIDEMLDFFIDSEFGNAEILQISGGEPTTHPQIIEIIESARNKGIKYVMLNTNGLRLAEDEALVKELAKFVDNFEIYFQFDGFDDTIYRQLRGRDLLAIKIKALENLSKYAIPTTLVSTIGHNLNEQEIGKIVEFAINSSNIRGINFQPIAFFGRYAINNSDQLNRPTITGIMKKIEEQTTGMIKRTDFIPLPCNVDRVAITYLFKTKEGFIPLTRKLDIKNYLPAIRNTFKFDPDDFLKDLTKNLFNFSCNCGSYLGLLKQIKNLVPKNYFLKSEAEKSKYIGENTFRISITSFLDAYNFDLKSMKKECVHIITPDLKKIPFSSYNILHRK